MVAALLDVQPISGIVTVVDADSFMPPIHAGIQHSAGVRDSKIIVFSNRIFKTSSGICVG